MSVVPAPVENGSTEADMATEEETWEQKEEPGGGGGGGGQENLGPGAISEDGATRKEEEEMMEEEEEEMPMPKVAPAPPDAPKKEHVNVVFIGHVGVSRLLVCVYVILSKGDYRKFYSLCLYPFLSVRCW